MKRILSIILAAILLCTMLPFSALASSDQIDERQRLVALATVTFPEYVEKFDTKSIPESTDYSFNSENPVRISETRYISDTHYLTYTELADGTAIVSEAQYTKSVVVTNSYTSGEVTVYTATMRAFCSESSDVFVVTGIQYTIHPLYNDTITGVGSTASSTAIPSELWVHIPQESGSTKAQLTYRATFTWGYARDTQALITMYVGGNTMTSSITPIY